MIKKLQKKFIMITMAALVLIILLLIGTINGINLYQMNHRINGTLHMLSENEGMFPNFEKGKPPRDNFKLDFQLGFQLNEETPFETRYFIVKINTDKTTREIDTSHIRAISSETAKEYAEKVLERGKRIGFYGNYKYMVTEREYGYMITFLDCRNSIQTVTIFFVISTIVALIILLLMFLLVSIFSKKAINPIIESMEKQKQFITDAGHEIKTPLAIISANTDVLELTSGGNEWTDSIRNQIARLDKLVKNLLMLSKMEEGNLNLIFKDFDISQTVKETASSFDSIAKMQKKEISMEMEEGVNLYGDEGSIHQLVSILLDNALKYSNENGKIRLRLFPYKKGIKLEVFNTVDMNSAVLPSENLNRLFDRFYRADSSRSRNTGGYGIGLSIAKSIAEAHHGKIIPRYEEEEGIVFVVTLG